MVSEVEVKTCTICGNARPLTEFYLKRRGRLDSCCKPCKLERKKRQYSATKDRVEIRAPLSSAVDLLADACEQGSGVQQEVDPPMDPTDFQSIVAYFATLKRWRDEALKKI